MSEANEPGQQGAVKWHTLSVEEAQEQSESPRDGLSSSERSRRLEEVGPNVLAATRQTTAWEMLLRQLKDPLLLVLIGAGALAMALGKLTDGAVVLAVVVVNTLIGFIQEYRANQAIQSLSELVADRAEVLVEGQWVGVDAQDLVPGDRVRLAAGDKVSADIRLTRVKTLKVDEAMLTGESVSAEKATEAVESEAQVGDQRCLAFKGTLVTYGSGEGIVVRTGAGTELGHVSEMLSSATELETPLTQALTTLGKQLTVAIIVLALAILGVGLYREMSDGGPFLEALRGTVMFAIALAVGAIPEGLPAIVTIALAIGVRRMAIRKAVVRKLPSVETLGSTTVICSDKTGTLTKNEMTVRRIWTPGGSFESEGVGYGTEGRVQRTSSHSPGAGDGDASSDPKGARDDSAASSKDQELLEEVCRAAVLCSDARIVEEQGRRRVEGDPTEGALVVIAEKVGLDPTQERQHGQRLDDVPFDSERKYMATLHGQERSPAFVVVKGAPEVIVELCDADDGRDPELVLGQVQEMAERGMRVLAVAKRDAPSANELSEQDVEQGGFRLLALFGMIDPPRSEAVESIRRCHEAGVTVKMITGDHLTTAEAIAKELAIHEGRPAIAGKELARMSDDELWEAARSSNVFARVSPESKLRLVRALQAARKERGRAEIVAMTGDGVNDAPALKQANIGVAMGITGTSASREAADLVLMDDNFATIVAAMEEGRRVYDNLIKSLAFVLPTNLALAFILVYAVLFFPFDATGTQLLLPIKPTQLLWINLVAAVALALPLAFESKEPDIMSRAPRDPSAPVFSAFLVIRTLLAAVLISALAIIAFSWHHERQVTSGVASLQALGEAQTLAVTTVVFSQIFYLLNCRSITGSVFKIGFFSNPILFAGVGVVLVLQALFVYVPAMHSLFASRSLGVLEVLLSAAAGALMMPLIGLEKWIRGRLAKQNSAQKIVPGASDT